MCMLLAGVGFHALFKQCRQKFLVGNEANLRAHLAEFRDHQLLRERCLSDVNPEQ